MIRFTFGQQVTVGLGMLGVSLALGHLFQTGIFENLACILYGSLCIANPVGPETWRHKNPAEMKREVQWIGALFIFVGLITHFTV